jgi:hypothetical protein
VAAVLAGELEVVASSSFSPGTADTPKPGAPPFGLTPFTLDVAAPSADVGTRAAISIKTKAQQIRRDASVWLCNLDVLLGLDFCLKMVWKSKIPVFRAQTPMTMLALPQTNSLLLSTIIVYPLLPVWRKPTPARFKVYPLYAFLVCPKSAPKTK